MTVYLAGSSAELERVKSFAARLELLGFEIAHRWWDLVEKFGEGNPINDATRRALSIDDILAVQRAPLFCLLVPEAGAYSHGAFFEAGYALARIGLSKTHQVFASGNTKRSIFLALFDNEFETDEKLLDYLGGYEC